MNEICKKCLNLPCRSREERRQRNLESCKMELKENKPDREEEDLD